MQNRPQNGFFCMVQDAECRMQNQTQRVCPLGAAHSFELDFASCIRILHPASGARHLALGPILHSAFCICILHRVQFTALELILHSAFCICILHDVMLVPGHKR